MTLWVTSNQPLKENLISDEKNSILLNAIRYYVKPIQNCKQNVR